MVNSFLSHVDLCYDAFDSNLARYGLSRNKWIDYMYASKPIVCSYDGYQSMINEAKCGAFVNFNDPQSLAKKIKEYSLLKKESLEILGNNAREFILKNRTFNKLASQYLEEIINS
jgi:glycosyltransferase involved in cell wall biosynthesis